TVYGAGSTVLVTRSIRNNTNLKWEEEITISDAEEVELVVLKWNKPNQQAKILSIFNSTTETYEDPEIIEISLQEEIEYNTGSIPIGVISSNELTIKLNNINRDFDLWNPNSRVAGLLIPNRRVEAYL